jgi:hypothetical protein
MSKPKLEWTKKGEASDFDAARNFLSLLYSDAEAKALVASLQKAKLVDHAAKDLLRAAQLPLLQRDEPHVDDDLKKIHKGKPLAPILLVRGDMTRGLPLIVADGYHRICAICYFDESAPIPASAPSAISTRVRRFHVERLLAEHDRSLHSPPSPSAWPSRELLQVGR